MTALSLASRYLLWPAVSTSRAQAAGSRPGEASTTVSARALATPAILWGSALTSRPRHLARVQV